MSAVETLAKPVRARRGRPSRAQAEAIDRRLLDAARDLFLGAGFDATSIEAIAERAGVTKVTLYARYPDKVTVLRAVLDDRLATWSRVSRQDPGVPAGTGRDRLRRLAQAMLEWSLDPEVRGINRLVAACHGNAEAIAHELDARLRAPMRELVERALDQHCTEAGIGRVDLGRLSALFLGMVWGLIDRAGFTRDDAAAMADHCVAILIDGRAAW